jgi:DNA-binding response OmpR family regulator
MGKILVVDDDPSVVFMLGEILRATGHAVVSTCDGRQALALLDGVDAVLVDLHLPGESGVSLIQRIRAAHTALPVILLTADAPDRASALASALGAFGVLPKPMDIDELSTLIDRAVTASQRLAPETTRS